ncbi:restriction endonuclease subunit S [Serratia fonticola]
MTVEKLITDHIDIWSSALQTRSTAGRGSNGKIDLYGIKKLRELILELAVRGKLVPQDPNDEPASELLKRIAAEKAELVKLGKIKKQKPLPEISEDEKPFELPVGWKWVRLGELSDAVTGNAFKTSEYTDAGVFVLRVTNINPDGTINLADKKFIPQKLAVTKYENFSLEQGDILLVMVGGSLGKIGIVNHECLPALLNQNMWKMVKTESLNHDFFIYGLKFININQLNVTHSTHGHLAQGDYLSKCFPLAPANEQNKIVEKVISLMSLCDQLEQQSLISLDAHQQLVETLLATLTDSQNAEEITECWARISQHFDTLFTTKASIDALKQTILQLAVMGKLVPQDPNDEPASELLKRIEQKKTQLVKEGKIKKQKPLPPISDEEKPFELPKGWEWCKFGLLSEFINGDRGTNYPNKNEYVDSGIPWINTGHIEKDGTLSVSDMNYITQKKFDELRGGKIQCGDLVYCLRGATFGKTSFVTPYKIGAIASSLMIIRPFITQFGLFFYNYLTSPFGKSQVFRFDNGSAQPNLSANSVMLYAFPCPPLDEQFRIYNKVQELFGICESLKTNIQSAQQTQLHLADALTDAALN